MQDRKQLRTLIFPIIFLVVLAPVLIVALLTFNPGGECAECDCATLLTVTHSHGTGLASAIENHMQLIFNVSPGADLYKLTDGQLELCAPVESDVESEIKHITVDVNDARFMLGERLPVDVGLEVRNAESGAVVVQASAPAMYSPGHGYHFGDNFRVPNGAAYEWTVTISPVRALRQVGAEDIWLEPVEWTGTFSVDAEGNVVGKVAPAQLVGDVMAEGLHVALSAGTPVTLYAVDADASVPQEPEPGARYFVVDVTDHSVNYEEKLPGADVTLEFAQGDESFTVMLDPVLAPNYGFHYGANVLLEPGEWSITVTVDGLDFLRHAGAAVSLGREPVSAKFTYVIPD